MKNKGFTLIELLAVVTVLGLIMLIAVPSTINVLEKNKKESMINDAKTAMRIVEAEDQKNNYINGAFTVNGKSDGQGTPVGNPNYRNSVTITNIKDSPYGSAYKIFVIYACNAPEAYNFIRYYRIYINDGKNQLRAVKGLPENLLNNTVLSYNSGNEPYNLTDTTVTRYKMVEKIQGNINSYMGCYRFK